MSAGEVRKCPQVAERRVRPKGVSPQRKRMAPGGISSNIADALEAARPYGMSCRAGAILRPI